MLLQPFGPVRLHIVIVDDARQREALINGVVQRPMLAIRCKLLRRPTMCRSGRSLNQAPENAALTEGERPTLALRRPSPLVLLGNPSLSRS
jgi:hypothetical protein